MIISYYTFINTHTQGEVTQTKTTLAIQQAFSTANAAQNVG